MHETPLFLMQLNPDQHPTDDVSSHDAVIKLNLAGHAHKLTSSPSSTARLYSPRAQIGKMFLQGTADERVAGN
jgi:hypothetical protein